MKSDDLTSLRFFFPPLSRFCFFIKYVDKSHLIQKTKGHVTIKLLGFFLFCFLSVRVVVVEGTGTACWYGFSCCGRPTSLYVADADSSVDFGPSGPLQTSQARKVQVNMDGRCLTESTDLICRYHHLVVLRDVAEGQLSSQHASHQME